MAFTSSGFSNDSRADGMRVHTYTHTDARATVIASGYFDGVDQYLAAGDKIECYDSTNGINFTVRVAAVTSGVVTTDDISGQGYEAVITTNVITASESGKVFGLSLAGGFTSTLPTAALGLKYTFLVKIAPTTAYIVLTASSANVIYGSVVSPDLSSATDVGNAAASDTITFAANKAIIGDLVTVECLDGTNWYVTRGVTNVFDGIALTQAS